MGTMHIFVLKGKLAYNLTNTSYLTNTYPVHECQVHSHDKGVSGKVNALGKVGQELMVEGLHPVCITTLCMVREDIKRNSTL